MGHVTGNDLRRHSRQIIRKFLHARYKAAHPNSAKCHSSRPLSVLTVTPSFRSVYCSGS